MDASGLKAFVEKRYPDIEKCLFDVGRIPNQSIEYDDDYFKNGLNEKCLTYHMNWIKSRKIPGLSLELVKGGLKMGPLLYVEVTPTDKSGETILMYGHLDKQPPLTEKWTKTTPYEPVKAKNDYGEGIYCRGLADDQYSSFTLVTALEAVKAQKKPHPRIVMLFETEEESGSPNIEFFVKKLDKKIGQPKLVICMDSGGGDYERLWLTTSLRGLAAGNVKATLIKNGVHSGGSGVVRDAFHCVRIALDRLEDAETGKMKVKELFVKIPPHFNNELKKSAEILGDLVWEQFPFHDGCRAQVDPKSPGALHELMLNKCWRPQMTITGIDGIPDLKGGNVVREHTTVKVSIRLPPSADPTKSLKAIERTVIGKAYPMGCKVTFEEGMACPGFCCPNFDGWMLNSMAKASRDYWGNDPAYYGEGGSIPFMDMLQKKFTGAQFMVTGLIGPESNAHAPDEYLNINMMKGLICAVANVVADASPVYCGTAPLNPAPLPPLAGGSSSFEEKAKKTEDLMASVGAGMSMTDFQKQVLMQLSTLRQDVESRDKKVNELESNNKELTTQIKKLKHEVNQKSKLLQMQVK